MGGSGSVEARDRAASGADHGGATADTRGNRATCDLLPSAAPSFLEACAKLAGEAAARHDFDRACALINKAAKGCCTGR